ncbi:hypothetical protein ABIB37_000380 [Agrococcus sp. UYP10]|uniref:hypothetical protein n=1 Tax=Agrococcus sp. UYP10 TaxID=1756355 RepID=UPI0033973E5D
MPEKLDLRRSLDCYRAQVGRIRLVEVPRLQHLMIDGHGDPNGEAFVGAFDDEAPTLAHLHDAWIPEHGLEMTGRHHEICLSDARRVPPERRRTILRQPVRAATPGRAGSRGSA